MPILSRLDLAHFGVALVERLFDLIRKASGITIGRRALLGHALLEFLEEAVFFLPRGISKNPLSKCGFSLGPKYPLSFSV